MEDNIGEVTVSPQLAPRSSRGVVNEVKEELSVPEDIIITSSGILLDIGCGANKQPRFVGMDKRPLPGVDIVHDLEIFPYPLEDESCLTIFGSHIVEHIQPKFMIDFMNELWRLLKPDGQLALAHPYGWSFGYIQDPTHCNPCNEGTWQYFDPDYPLYQIYTPKPWKIAPGFPVWQENGNMEILMSKRQVVV